MTAVRWVHRLVPVLVAALVLLGAASHALAHRPVAPEPIQFSVMEVLVSSLPLLFKKEGLIEKHQVEGVDPSDRYFNRTVLVNRTPSGYAAKVMYEALTVEGHSHPTIPAAVQELIELMQGFGFTKLRTRANFKGVKYLAEKETWLDYQDLA